jgi:DNA-binding CsgD family transcriptional regulator
MTDAHASEVSAARRHLIKRPRLTRMLDESGARIILLVAPAGYGKTTLARQWLEGKPHVWYRGSPSDADVAALAVGIASTAAAFLPNVDQRIRERLRATENPEREARVLAEIVAEDLAGWPKTTWLTFDDYHFATESQASEEFLETLLSSTSVPLIATSRRRPAWATARRILYGEMISFERDTLAMTDPEVEAVIRRGRRETPVLYDLACGWPAVIGLAGMTGMLKISHEHIPPALHDFLAEELWQQATQSEQWELARVSIAPSLSREVARVLVGKNAEGVLQFAVRTGWLAPEEEGFALHPLLRSFLNARFAAYPLGDRESTISRLLNFLIDRHSWDEAMSVAVLYGRANQVTDVVRQALPEFLTEGRLPSLERWLAAAAARGITAPVLDFVSAEIAFRHADYARAELLALRAASGLEDRSLCVRSLNRAGHSVALLNRSKDAIALHQRARELADDAPGTRESIIGEIFATLDDELPDAPNLTDQLIRQLPETDGSATDKLRRGSLSLQVAVRLGGIDQALSDARPLVQIVQEVPDPLVRTSFMHLYAGSLAIAGHYREALKRCGAVLKDAGQYRLDLAINHASITRSVAECGLKNFAFGRSLVRQVISAAFAAGDAYLAVNGRALEARLHILDGAGVPDVDRSHLLTEAPGSYAEYLASIALAAASAGHSRQAKQLVGEALEISQAPECRSLTNWTYALMAVRSNSTDAHARIQVAFSESWNSGFIDPVVWAYRACPSILGLLARDQESRSRLSEVLRRAEDAPLAQRWNIDLVPGPDRNSTLSPREREVYALLAQGLSNRAIAERLYISVSTAKVHVRHILEKLEASSRTEAAAKWRDTLYDSLP